MQLQVLGPVGAVNGETTVALGGPRQRAVLAVLVAFANEAVSADRLIDEVWGDAPPAAARNSLQSMVSNLRKALKPDSRISIEGEGRGYALRAPVDAIDSLDFAARVDEARGLIGTDVDAGVRLLQGALELWRGAPYGDLADEVEVLRAEAARLEELRMRALEYRIEGEFTTGDPADVVGELEGLVEAHPLREGLSRLLMVALQQSGRQAEALRVASALRQRLAQEIGIEPSPELVRLEQEILDQSVDVPAPTAAANPYRGLESFTEADASRFFGRESLTQRLVARLGEDVEGSRLLAVVGASGSGKSSVVRAGLVPALRAGAVAGSQDWVVVQIVPGVTPMRDLETALLRVAVNPPPTLLEQLTRDELGLRDTVSRVLPDDGSELLLVVDQFEELFTIADPDEGAQFIDGLVGAVTASASRVRIVITLRADFYDRPLGHRGLAPLLAQRMETVVEMTPDELSQAIVGPAELAGVTVEAGLVAAVVADATGQPGALPMVQYALTELFEQRDSDTLTLAGYHELGGVRGAIRRRAETVYNSLDEGQQTSARNALLQLVTLGEGEEDTRRRIARDDLTGDTSVVYAFAAARLVSLDQDPATEKATVEVAHEALLREWPRFSRWIDENRDDIRTHRRLQAATNDWIDNDRAPSYLLTGERLAGFQHWRRGSNQTLATAETELLAVSEEAVAAEQGKRAATRRRVVTTLAAATIVSLVLAAFALVRSDQATEQTRIAEVRELAGSAIAALATDPELSLLLALEAVEREPLPEAQEALHQAIAAQRVLMTIPAAGGAAAYLDDSTVAALNEDGTITIYDISGGHPVEQATLGQAGWLATEPTRFPPQMLVSDKGHFLAVGTADGYLVVVDVAGGTEMWRHKVGDFAPWIAMTTDGSLIAARAIERAPEGSFRDRVKGGVFTTATGEMSLDFGDCCTPVAITRNRLPENQLLIVAEDESPLLVDVRGDGRHGVTYRTLPSGEHRDDPPVISKFGWQFHASGQSFHVALNRGKENEVVVLRVGTGEIAAVYGGHTSDIWDLDVDRTDSRAASGGADGTAHVWSLRTGQQLLTLAGHPGGVFSVEFSRDGSQLLTVGAEGLARIWDISPLGGAEFLTSEPFPFGYTAQGTQVAFVAGTSRVVVRASNGGAATVVYDLSSGERTEMTHTAGESMALTPTGETLAVARKGRINLFNLQSGLPAQSFGEARDVETPFLTYSPDGRSIAVGSEDGDVDVFDLATGRRTRILHGGRDLRAIFFKANGDLVTADGRGDIYIWDVDAAGSPVEKITVGAGIAGATTGGGVLVMGDRADWYSADLETFAPLFAPTFAHPGGITAGAINVDGSVFATGGRDGTVKIWDLETGAELMALTGAPQPIQSVAINHDGDLVAAMAADRVFRVYTLDIDKLMEIGRSKATRPLTDVECRQYLRSECPGGG